MRKTLSDIDLSGTGGEARPVRPRLAYIYIYEDKTPRDLSLLSREDDMATSQPTRPVKLSWVFFPV